jgi:hypothetical protein
MNTLYLTVNAFQCKKGKVFPEFESDWTRSELEKILSLSGVSGTIPNTFTYNDIINLLIDRLNVQKPAIYALNTHKNIILNSQTVEVSGDLLTIGPYAVVHKLEDESCEHIWDVFFKYFHTSQRFVMEKISPEQLREKQLKIIQLQDKVEKLEKQLKEGNIGRLTAQFEEANQLLKTYKARIVEETQKDFDTQLKNTQLMRNVQQLEAQILQYKSSIDKIRSKLGQNWEQSLDELAELKRRLEECESKRME